LAAIERPLSEVPEKGKFMKNIKIVSIISLLVLLSLSACTSAPSSATGKTMDITVSILPEKYFVERVGGNLVSVNVMVGPGADPHTYEPKPEQMAAISRSALYFRIGVEFEGAWMKRFSSTNPNMKIVDLSEGIQKLPIAGQQGGQAPASGETLDPHVWTSPVLVKPMVERIYKELTALDPANESTFKSNRDAFLKDIEALDKDIHASLDGLQNRNFMVFHPAWAYFAKDYNLQEISIEIGGTEPSANELAMLIDMAKADNIKVVFAQPEFSTQIAKYIAKEIGGQVVLISPLTENWLDNLRQVAQIFKKSL
jgi:zinc transport system substrate-binding protein